MKPPRWSLLLLAFSALLGHAQEPLRLCYDDADNFPWLVKNGQGLNNVLVDLAAQQSGLRVIQTPLPWRRCLASIANGEVAGGFAASYSEERESFADYPRTVDGKLDVSRRLKNDGYSLYRRKDTAAHWNGKQFVNLTGRIGSQLGYASTAELRKHSANVYESNDSPETAMRHLLAGDLELLALMTLIGDELLKNPEIARRVEKIPSPFVEKPYFVIFNKNFQRANPASVEAFWKGLGNARESAQYKGLFREQCNRGLPAAAGHPQAPFAPPNAGTGLPLSTPANVRPALSN